MAKKEKQTGSRPPESGSPEVGEVSIELPIEWHTGSEIISRYANQAIVQAAQNECHLSFFEVRPPHVTGSPEEMQTQAKELKAIRAECVARIVIPHDLLARIVQAFQEIIERKQKQEAKATPAGVNDNSTKESA